MQRSSAQIGWWMTPNCEKMCFYVRAVIHSLIRSEWIVKTSPDVFRNTLCVCKKADKIWFMANSWSNIMCNIRCSAFVGSNKVFMICLRYITRSRYIKARPHYLRHVDRHCQSTCRAISLDVVSTCFAQYFFVDRHVKLIDILSVFNKECRSTDCSVDV